MEVEVKKKKNRPKGIGPYNVKPKPSKRRDHCQLRAFPDEFASIQRYMYIMREIGVEKAEEFLDGLNITPKKLQENATA